MTASQTHQPATVAIRTDLGAIFVSLELSRSKWLITSLSPGGGEKLSRREVAGSALGALLSVFSELRAKSRSRMGQDYPIVVIQEAGLDGFWLDRALRKEGIESHVVDPASDRGSPAQAAGQDGQDRRRDADPNPAGL